MTDGSVGPVRPDERLVTLDVLRAFALLGILVMNMPFFFSSGWDFTPPHERWPAAHDRVAWWVMDTFFSGKFNSLFAFLFGVGFTIQLERLMARSDRPLTIYLRRLIVLFFLGVAHGVLLWFGDVLHVYAVLGVALVLLRRAPDRLIVAVVVFGLLLPTIFAIHQLFTYTPADVQSDRSVVDGMNQVVVDAHMRGGYLDVVRSNLAHFRLQYADVRGYLFYPAMLMTILLGFYFGRRRHLQDAAEHIDWWRRLAAWSFAIGIASALMFSLAVPYLEPFTQSWLGVAVTTAYSVQRPALMLFYASAIVLLTHSARWGGFLQWFAPMGRMPLTNYLMQSVICTTLFNAYGFGLYGRVGPAFGMAAAVIIFGLQVVWSRWWFTRFQYGPMEWVWRVLTYGRAPAMGQAETATT